jgi:glycerol-3-phosphate dehydrogenase
MRVPGGLGPRDTALEKLASTVEEPLDLLVVGGGITGAGIALDAAARGMSVGLVERLDFASGTSSKSSKLVHGGLRYLEQREFGLVREASSERDLLIRLAPHLVEPIPFAIPVSDRWIKARFGVGLWAYDALATFRNLRVHRRLDQQEIEDLIPPLPKNKIKGGYLFYDSKTDDVRLVMEVLVQACRYGATVANYAAVRDLSGSDEMCEAFVEDTISGSLFRVRAKRVALAGGVWTDRLEGLANNQASPRLRPSKGVHLVFSKDALPLGEAAAFIPDAERERMLFVIPWLDHVLVGTTDTTYEGDIDHPTVDENDRDYCLGAVNHAFGLSLDSSDVAGAYAGLRPLIMGKRDATSDLSRRHAVYDVSAGVFGITGGKLTTYRRMAREAVDRVVDGLGMQAKSKTHWIKLGCSDLSALGLAVERRARRLGVSDASAEHLIRSYGDRALAVLDLAADADLTTALVSGYLPIGAEASYCARSEMAVELSDLLSRRTRLSLIDPAAGVGKGSRAAEIMGREHGWWWRERRRQVDAHRIDVQTERGLPVGSAAPRATARVATTLDAS